MEIKDYLHLYIGCEVLFGNGNIKGRLIDTDGINANYYTNAMYNISIDKIKPLLRPLNTITYSEAVCIEADWIDANHSTEEVYPVQYNPYKHRLTAEDTLYLLNQGFDLFGLIDAGLAIDKTRLAQEQTKNH